MAFKNIITQYKSREENIFFHFINGQRNKESTLLLFSFLLWDLHTTLFTSLIFLSSYLFYLRLSWSPVDCFQLHPTLFSSLFLVFLSSYLLSFFLFIFLSFLSKVQLFTCGVSPRLSPVTLFTSLFLIFLSFYFLIFFYLMFSCSPVVCLLDCLQSRPISLKHFRQPQHSPTLPYFGFHQVCFLRRTKCPKWMFIAIVIAEIILKSLKI